MITKIPLLIDDSINRLKENIVGEGRRDKFKKLVYMYIHHRKCSA